MSRVRFNHFLMRTTVCQEFGSTTFLWGLLYVKSSVPPLSYEDFCMLRVRFHHFLMRTTVCQEFGSTTFLWVLLLYVKSSVPPLSYEDYCIGSTTFLWVLLLYVKSLVPPLSYEDYCMSRVRFHHFLIRTSVYQEELKWRFWIKNSLKNRLFAGFSWIFDRNLNLWIFC